MSAPADPSGGPGDDLGFSLPSAPRYSKGRVLTFALVGVIVVAALFVLGWWPRRHERDALAASVAEASKAVPRYEIVHPAPVAPAREQVLPGAVLPLAETTLFARVDGFVKTWSADIGDQVAAGQVLAEIDIPELGQQIAAAKAELARSEAQLVQSRATRQLSQQSLDRYQKLAAEDGVAHIEVDQRKAQALADAAGVAAMEASVAAAKAQLALLQERQGYGTITAPFAGTITRRGIERGAHVTAQTELFDLAATDTVRVVVQVPQALVPSIHAGLDATVNLREYPSTPFPGKVTRSSGELDAVRTMRVEIQVPNAERRLVPGMYAEVHLTLPSPLALLEIPSTALYSDAQGVRVAIADANGKVRFQPVVIERDTGPTLQISSGLRADDRVLKLASATLADGAIIDAVEPPPEPAKPSK